MRRCEFVAIVKHRRTEEEMKELVTPQYNLDWQREYNSTYEKPTYMEGYFHEWGMQYVDDSNSCCAISVGIVEDLAGNIHMVDPTTVKFVDRR